MALLSDTIRDYFRQYQTGGSQSCLSMNEQQLKAHYGAISIGDVWCFGVLQHAQKCVLKDINSYTVPGDLDTVFSILVGIVAG